MSELVSPIKVGPAKDVLLLHDGSPFAKTVARLLALDYRLGGHNLERDPAPAAVSAQALVCCFSRFRSRYLAGVRALAQRFAAPPVVLLAAQSSQSLKLVEEMPGTVCLFEPLNFATLKQTVKQALNTGAEAAWSKLQPQNRQALQASSQSFQSCFAASARGEPLPVEQVFAACRAVKDSFAGANFGEWLSALQLHHDRSYRHSMLVCASLTQFCQTLGVRDADLERVTVGGFLHDIGKFKVPLDILDKPGALDATEEAALQRHPSFSRDILLAETGLDPSIIEMAVQHHENLDGSGYPDGLTGEQISDLVRLTAVADVFTLLTEDQTRQAGRTPEAALEVMANARGHLDLELVRRFRAFVLDGGADAAAA